MGWKVRKTTEQFIQEMSVVRPDVTVLGEYIDSRIRIKMLCNIHGCEFVQSPTNALSGKCGCSICKYIKRGEKRRKSNEQFLYELYQRRPYMRANSPYVDSKTKVSCTCLICGYTNDYYPVTLTHGSGGCFMCGNKKISEALAMSEEEFVRRLKIENPDIIVTGGYINASQHVDVECLICGHKWSPVAKVLLHGTGCPHCSKSRGEKMICRYLDSYNIVYNPQKSFDDLIGIGGKQLSYDFYLPNENILIEYQGAFHDGTAQLQTEEAFIKQQEHDRRKRIYAASHGIQLLEIWYWDFDNIEEILNHTLHNLVTTTAV